MNAVDPDHPAQLLVNDNHSGRTFLIDTGAQVSLLPATAHARRHPSSIAPINWWQLTGVLLHHMGIASYGTHVQLGKRKFTVTFIIADVRRPILGADFLRSHKLLVDLCGQKLIDAHLFQSYACAATNNDLCVYLFSFTFQKKSENLGGGGGLNPLNPPPPLKYALVIVSKHISDLLLYNFLFYLEHNIIINLIM